MFKHKVKRIDPSKTTLISRGFLSDMNKRFLWLYNQVKQFIVTDDAFGLEERPKLVIHAAPGQYAFVSNPQKLKIFRQWLEDQVNAGVLEVSGGGTPGKPWTYKYVQSAYAKGVMRAYADSRKKPVSKSKDWYYGGQAEFLRSSFAQPVLMAKVELLALRALEQLRGVTASMSQQMNRILSEGLVNGWGPLRIAREMQNSIYNLSITRARMIARTEIIYAHAEGQLDSFQALGIEKLGILAEFSTAGDELVCRECAALEGNIYTVDEARGVIPLHPSCRCCWIPSEEQY